MSPRFQELIEGMGYSSALSKRIISCIYLLVLLARSSNPFNLHIMMPIARRHHPSISTKSFIIIYSQNNEASKSTICEVEEEEIASLGTATRRKRRPSKERSSSIQPVVNPFHITESNNNTVPKSRKNLDPVYWKDQTDSISIQNEMLQLCNQPFSNNIDKGRKRIQFQVHGNPLSLRRHRTAHGFMYNPSAADQRIFREVVASFLPINLIPREEIKHNPNDDFDTHQATPETRTIVTPFFQADERLIVHIVFYMKRPKTHFVASNPQSGRIQKFTRV